MRVAIIEYQKIVVENKKFIEELQKFKHAEKERDLKNKLRANENMAQRKNLKIKWQKRKRKERKERKIFETKSESDNEYENYEK